MGQCASLTVAAVDPATASAEASKERLRQRTEQLSQQKKRTRSRKQHQQARDVFCKGEHDSASSTLVDGTSSYLAASTSSVPQRSSVSSDPFGQRHVSSQPDKKARPDGPPSRNSGQKISVLPEKRQEEKRSRKKKRKPREESVQKEMSSQDNSMQDSEPAREESSTSNSTDQDVILNQQQQQQQEDNSCNEHEEDDIATSIRSCRRSRRLSMELAALPNLSPMNIHGNSSNRKQQRFDSSWMGLSFSDHNKEEAKDSYRAQRTTDGAVSSHSRSSAVTATEMSKSKQCALGNLLGGTPHYFTDAPDASNENNLEEDDEMDDSMKDFGY